VGFENIFAIGDASVMVNNPLPQLAQPALQMGKHAAKQIARLHRGLETETFSCRDKGTMATIGRGDAVLETPVGIKLTGVPAWLGWIALHIFFLLGGRKRVQTLVNLGARYAGPRRSNAIVGDVMETPRVKAMKRSALTSPPSTARQRRA
jgi:NADH dehydrogenase